MLELLFFSKGNSCFYIFLQDIVSGEEDIELVLGIVWRERDRMQKARKQTESYAQVINEGGIEDSFSRQGSEMNAICHLE